jgi:hypothetical protein
MSLEATKKLYRILFDENDNADLADLQECIDNGAKLTDIECSEGIPIVYAMELQLPAYIIQFLANNGGIDMNSNSISDYIFWYYLPDGDFNDIFIMHKNNIMNTLIILYNKSIGSRKVDNYILQNHPYIDFNTIIPDDEITEYEMKLNLLVREYCKILNINYDDLHDKNIELCGDFLNFGLRSKLISYE